MFLICNDLLKRWHHSLKIIFTEQFLTKSSIFCFVDVFFVWPPSIFQGQAKHQKYSPCFKTIFPFLITMKKRMSIAIYVDIYIYLSYNICDEKDSKSKRFRKLNTTVCQCCSKRLLCSVSYFRISTFDPVRHRMTKEDSYYLLSHKG